MRKKDFQKLVDEQAAVLEWELYRLDARRKKKITKRQKEKVLRIIERSPLLTVKEAWRLVKCAP